MIDVKHPLRKAYYQLLNGALSYGSIGITVGEDTVDIDDDLYVVLASQSGSDNSTFQTFDSNETIDVDIVCKGDGFVSKNIVDDVAGQILGLVLPNHTSNGLPTQSGIQITCVYLTGDSYLGFALNNSDSVIRRILTFSQKVRQT